MRIIEPKMTHKFKLPNKIDKDVEYCTELEKKLTEYFSYIKKIKGLNPNCINNVKLNIDRIKRCMRNYYNANILKAQDNIIKILKKYVESPFIVAPLKDNYAFRGCAPEQLRPECYKKDEDSKKIYEEMLEHKLSFFRARVSNEKLNHKDMLHIPFNLRSRIQTQRFSIPGVPCLYLATTTYGAWKELDEPKAEKFQVSAFKMPEDLRILNLCITSYSIDSLGEIHNEKERNVLENYLEIFPLVIATSYRVLEEKRTFKSEYVISQLVMQSARKLKIDGVAYLSKRTEDFFAYPLAVNLAILIPDNFDGRKYWSREKDVKWTKPIRFSDVLSEINLSKYKHEAPFSSYVNQHFGMDDNRVYIIEEGDKYIETDFSKFDEILVKSFDEKE